MKMAKCTVQLLNQHCPWFSTKPSDLMQWSMEDLRLDLTWGGELSFLSMVQDLLVSNFRPKLLRFRSTSSYGFSFSVEKTCSCWNKMIFKPQANVRQEGLTLTKAMNRGQQRVPGAQLGLDIAAQEGESKVTHRWLEWFPPQVTVSTEATAHLKVLDTMTGESQSRHAQQPAVKNKEIHLLTTKRCWYKSFLLLNDCCGLFQSGM